LWALSVATAWALPPLDMPLPRGTFEDAAPRAAAVVPGRLVVKYAATIDACVHCQLAHGRSLASVGGHAAIDALHERFHVQGARSVFTTRHGLGGVRARSLNAARLSAITQRFPRRAARAHLADYPDLSGVYELELPPDVDLDEAAAAFAADPDVVYAQPVREMSVSVLPNDPYLGSSGSWGQSFADLWGLPAIQAPTAWGTSTGTGVVVAVIDTGVDFTHPDLQANLWTNAGEIPGNGIDDDNNGFVDDRNGWDFASGDADPTDQHGHGTHVAGTIAGVGNNAIGVAGVAWTARIMPVKGLSDSGSGSSLNLAEALAYAAENGADVINNSWGGFGPNDVIFDAITAADALGAVVVSAAGNNGAYIDNLLFLPGGHPHGLTVGAENPDGTLASFSNYGAGLSIVAPGVDVLSLRSAHGNFDNSLNVGDNYLRLSGTSMATPHASGVAALLLSVQPTLSTSEVRWHLELGADQPGAPGYEGTPRNPTYGYGRLNAVGAFTEPPITTRLSLPGIRTWHAFHDVTRVPGNPPQVLFTSPAPVAWSTTAPPWLTTTATGNGEADLPLVLDATAVPAGIYDGSLQVNAPATTDGGAAFDARVAVHDDLRAGPAAVIATEGYGTIIDYAPTSAGNGLRTLTAWQSDHGVLTYSLLDAAGTVSGPQPVVTNSLAIAGTASASDGHEFLLAWRRYSGNRGDPEQIFAVRISADGTLVGAPIELFSVPDSSCRRLRLDGAGFDGTDYWVGYHEASGCSDLSKLYVTQLHPDGSFGKATKVATLATSINARFACRTGGCLFAWMDRAIAETGPFGKYIRNGYALALHGTAPVLPARQVLHDMFGFTGLATDGNQFFGLSQRYFFCATNDLCRTQVIGVRIAGDGNAIDPEGLVVSNVPEGDRQYPWPGDVAFDGTDWIASYQALAVDDSAFDDGSYVFANRIDASGVPQSPEYLGWLVDAHGRASESVVIAAATATAVIWEDGSTETVDGVYPHPRFDEHRAQRMFPHPPPGAFQAAEIGAIGGRTVQEGEPLRLHLLATGLDPGTVAFTATGLPPGALFDPGQALLQWVPGAATGGSVVSIHFAATAGATTVSEDVAITVLEHIRSVHGLVRQSGGAPIAGAALKVTRVVDKHRTIITGPDGYFHLEGHMSAGAQIVIKLTKPTTKTYRPVVGKVVVTVSSGDVVTPDLVADPH
jgi:subtilisin family serine protease